MISPENFTHGGNGIVYRLHQQGKGFLPVRADLVKEEAAGNNVISKVLSITNAKNIYYGHRIANLLLPGSVIEVVGTEVAEERFALGVNRLMNVYSLDAKVNPDHATYSAHMIIDHHEKVMVCNCEVCRTHHELHRWIYKEAEKLFTELGNIGIYVPLNDPSDYCFIPTSGKKPHVIFFEIERIDPVILEEYLDGLEGLNSNQVEAFKLLQHYNKINSLRTLFLGIFQQLRHGIKAC